MTRRWSGYETQSEAWQRGYEWAHHRGAHKHKAAIEAMRAHRYDLATKESDEFLKGAKFAQIEQRDDDDG